ncbi:MAG: hypothetical protein M3O02_09200 [Acidobacteriota bacterium]|nr:hypothetical protein [Acidobacteriota bacterium]
MNRTVHPVMPAAGRVHLLPVLVLAGCVLAGCESVVGCKPHETPSNASAPAPAMKPAPPTPVEQKREQLGGPTWDPTWDKLVEQALPASFLSPDAGRDLRSLCPRFDTLPEADKRAFWAYFFQALAAAEAGLKPTSNVRHTEPAVAVKDKVTGAPVHSEGLLQLTYEDSERYGCDFNWEADRRLPASDGARSILQPRNNLECGIRILDQQLFTQHKPLLSSSSYWSTLRPGTASYRVWAKQMTNEPAACGAHAGAAAGAHSPGHGPGASTR